MASNQAVLDWTAYPYVFDSILDFSSRSTLLAISATSKSVRKLAQIRLQRHLHLDHTERGYRCSVMITVYRSQWTLHESPPLGTKGGCSMDERTQVSLSRARILDVETPLSQHGLMYCPGRQSLGRVHTIRYMISHDPPDMLAGVVPNATQLVAFLDLASERPTFGWYRSPEPAKKDVFVPNGIERLVITAYYDPTGQQDLQPVSTVYLPGRSYRVPALRQVVVILISGPPPVRRPMHTKKLLNPPPWLPYLDLSRKQKTPRTPVEPDFLAWVRYLIKDLDKIHYTFVGVPFKSASSDSSQAVRSFKARLAGRVAADVAAGHMRFGNIYGSVPEAIEGVRFMTREQYRASVPEDQHELETRQ